MAVKRRSLKRSLGERRYKKLIIIAAEGSKTEPHYFSIFNDLTSAVRVICLKGKNRSSPLQVLKRMKTYIEEASLQFSDEAWLVIDKDNWCEEQLTMLYEWSKTNKRYGLALSNPKFEYWLLLHFEEGYGVSNGKDCSTRLKKYLPDYDKSLDPKKVTREMIDGAVNRALKIDSPCCERWPLKSGSTVYRLVQKILA